MQYSSSEHTVEEPLEVVSKSQLKFEKLKLVIS